MGDDSTDSLLLSKGLWHCRQRTLGDSVTVKMSKPESRYSFDVPNICIDFATLNEDDVHNADSWFGKLLPTP